LKSEQDILLEVERLNYRFFYKTCEVPKPYIGGRKLKAFLLGCDPGNKSNEGKTVLIDTVFGLENINSPYFKKTKLNLNQLGLDLEDLYIQNVCRNYFYTDTFKQKESDWKKAAKYWLDLLKKEFNEVDSKIEVPVFITSEIIFNVLLNNNRPPAIEIYTNKRILEPNENFLERKLIALYRHQNYQLKKWPDYKNHIIQLLN
jgi:hypothetical protein